MSKKLYFIFLVFVSCSSCKLWTLAEGSGQSGQSDIPTGNLVVKKGSPLVLTADGPLRGKILTAVNSETIYYAFKGIRFARPAQRFQPPEEPEPWKEVKNAFEFGSKCPQVGIMNGKLEGGDEDCLFLNVYVPSKVLTEKADLPVMFWIHGGGFLDGAGSFFGADYFMEDSSVILVTVNYRLGILGFLDIEGVVPGNNGLRDIIQGLKWVKRNIRAFHGDSNRVTIFGESAGGCATHLIARSSAARGLFHGAIAQSGNALCTWCLSTPTSQAEVVQHFSTQAKCPKNDPLAFVECLKSADVSILSDALSNLSFKSNHVDLLVTPTVEKPHKDLKVDLIVSSPPNLIQNQKEAVEKIPIIFGVNEEEGLLSTVGYLLKNGTKVRELSENWLDFAPAALGFRKFVPKEKQWEVSEKLRQFYFGGSVTSGGAPEISRKNIGNLTTLFSDYFFYRGTYQSALNEAREGNPVYLYLLKYMGDYSIAHSLGFPSTKPSHADELKFLFPSQHGDGTQKHWPDRKKGSKDEDFSKRLVRLWTSFATNLEPKTEEKDQVSWSPIRVFSGDKNPTGGDTGKIKIQWLSLHEKFEMVEETQEISRRIKFLDKLFAPYENEPIAGNAEKSGISKTEL